MKPYGHRSREQRLNDRRADELIGAAKRAASSSANTDLLLGKLISEVQLSNLLAISGNDLFDMQMRRNARDDALEIIKDQA